MKSFRALQGEHQVRRQITDDRIHAENGLGEVTYAGITRMTLDIGSGK